MDLILYPAIVLGSMGIIFGAVLAIASKKFAVEVDQRVADIREVLPGANCGGCGYPGCDGFASAVVGGGAPVSGCPVGGPDCAAAIADIMGVDAAVGEKQSARVLCQGENRVCADKYAYEGIYDCTAAHLIGGGYKGCRFACLGFGNCVRACKFDAISIENGIAVIDETKCTACGMCVDACPKGCIELCGANDAVLVRCRNHDRGKQVSSICKKGCISCRKCVKACEFGAVSFEANLPVIDNEKCTGCFECVMACPNSTINALREPVVG